MSKRHNLWLRQWQDTRDSISGCRFVRDGESLPECDCALWVDALISQGILACDLELVRCDKVARRWVRRVAKHDVLVICKVWKEAAELITRYASQGIENDIFTQLALNTSSFAEPRVVQLALEPIREALGAFQLLGHGAEFRRVYQWLVFTNHLTFKVVVDPERNDEVMNAYIAADNDMPAIDCHLARALNEVMRKWLHGFRVRGVPTHGPGNCSDVGREDPLVKYKSLAADQLLRYVIRRSGLNIEELLPNPDASYVERTSQLVLVPKTVFKPRIICEEPVALMWFQQMVKRDLYDWFGWKWELRKRIPIRDADANKEAARDGSYFGDLSTIDLSAASDSVSWDLARSVFAGTSLMPWLYACRSTRVQVGQRTIRPRKFASMGSALTFPVECLIFAAICEVAIHSPNVVRGRESFYTVYGDDIVINTEYVPVVVDYLNRLGFTVNHEKSFTDHKVDTFRESCGGFYLGGMDVTPFRLSRKYEAGFVTPASPESFVSTVSLLNGLRERGFDGCWSWFYQKYSKLPSRLRPTFGSSDSVLHSWGEVTNFQAKGSGRKPRPWPCKEPFYQRREVRGGTTRKTFLNPSEESRLLKGLSPNEREARRIARKRGMPVCRTEYESLRYFHWWMLAKRDPKGLDGPRIADLRSLAPSRLVSRFIPVD